MHEFDKLKKRIPFEYHNFKRALTGSFAERVLFMKLKKRLISLLLAVAVFVCIIPSVNVTAHAAVSGYEIVSYARQYIGYPYKHGAKGPNAFDCSGFAYYVFKHFGIELSTGASNIFNNASKYGTVVGKGSVANAQMGDLVVWSGHVAIYTENGYCVEALGTKYGVVEKYKVDRHKSNGKNYKVIRVSGVKAVGAPKISSLTNTESGVEIKWDKVKNAEKYRVLRKTGSGSWSSLGTTSSANFVDKTAASGKTYSYTVRCITSDSKAYTSTYDEKGKSIKFIATPKLTAVSNTVEGVKISWGKVSGAAKYRVYCKTASTGWKGIADTTANHYTWTGAKSGTKYKFTVRCVTGDGKSVVSDYDAAGIGITYIEAPKLVSVSSENAGTVIKWNKVAGATKYGVYYKNADGSWTKIADTADTSYTWTGAKIGKQYTFTVKCISGVGSGYDSNGKSITGVATPKLSAVTGTAAGIKISWGKVSGAEKYRVFYKANGENTWHKAGDTASASFNWTGAKSGTKYKFAVRCISSDGKTYISGYNTAGIDIAYVAAPKLKSVSANGNGTTVKWERVEGAEKYRVLRKTAGGSWEKLADTTSASYTDKSAKLGSKYYYTVRCISGDSKSYTSAYNATGICAAGEPKLPSLTKTANGITISWDKAVNAEKYRVFYKANGESTWHKAGDTTSTSFTWTGAKSGTKYTFTVRCISKDGTAFTSTYNTAGKSIDYIAAPKISGLSNTASGVQINWGKVAGAAKYRVFYKANGESTWHVLGDTASTSYTWTGAKSGTKYTFTVRCISNNGTFISAYDATGKSIIL